MDNKVKFNTPETAQVMDPEIVREGNRTRNVSHNTITEEWKLEDFSDEGERLLPINGIRHGSTNRNTYTIKSDDPLSAHIQCEWELTVGREEWQTKLVTNSEMISEASTFYLTDTMIAFYNEEDIFRKTWTREISRDYQ